MAKAAQQKEKTAQERYDEAVERHFEAWLEQSFSREALKGVPLYELKLPLTGIVFKVRNLSNEFLVQSGAVAVGNLSADVLNTKPIEHLTPEERQQRAEEEYAKLSDEEKLAQTVTVVRQIRYICVEPRVVMGPVNGHKNAVSITKITGQDFTTLAERSNPMRGDAAPGLKTFRAKRR